MAASRCIRYHSLTKRIKLTHSLTFGIYVCGIGNPLPLTQEQILSRVKGCAIEARIYAENPMREFLPATGRLAHMHTPDIDSLESGIRADYGIRSGDSISTFYDPMIAKLIAYDETREKAVGKLERALRGFQAQQYLLNIHHNYFELLLLNQVAGLVNNIDFLVDTARHSGFSQKQATTAFFSEHLDGILQNLAVKGGLRNESGKLSDHTVMAIAGLNQYNRNKNSKNKTKGPWAGSEDDWRKFGSVKRQMSLLPGGSAIGTQNSKIVEDVISIESVGSNKLILHSTLLNSEKSHIPPINVTVRSVSPVLHDRAAAGESVSQMRIEINGKFRTGTVSVHVAVNGATVADGAEF